MRERNSRRGIHAARRIRIWTIAVTFCAMAIVSGCLQAQGILTVTPSRTAATTAGDGSAGYAGDGAAATSASLAAPSALAYDASGNLYIADTRNHVVREILASGTIVTVAGSGIAGLSGDGGPATSASLDTPTGIAIDAGGALYIADSHNHRIRKVTGGTISTIAGSGVAGFSGDSGPATSATFALPSALAFDANNNLYIADTNNHRIRRITGTTVTTIAGNGEEFYAGDGGPATAASLDLPTGVAFDASGRLYIADRHNHRIRRVDTSGVITTVAGSGAITFAGAFSGDGSNPTAATLAKPSGIYLDAAGNLFVADSNNQRIRQISNGAIATIAGTGEQGFAGDGGFATSAVLNAPRALAFDPGGTLLIGDTLNQRLRSAPNPTLSFASQVVGTASPTQSITLANSGTAPTTLSPIAFTGPFAGATGGTCVSSAITLAPGASCTQSIAFLPTSIGAASGSVAVTGSGVIPATVLLTGTAVRSATTLTLATSTAAPLAGQPITFTATIKPAGSGTPTGTVTFSDGSTPLGTAQAVSAAGTASITTTTLAVGSHSITASYSGDTNFGSSVSSALTQTVADFTFTVSTTDSPAQTVTPGQPATFGFVVQPMSTSFHYPVVLSATGLPPGATVSFNPPTLTLGGSATSFQMTIQTAASTASFHRTAAFGGVATLAILLLPFNGRLQNGSRKLRPLLLGCFLLLGFAATGVLTGCGSRHELFPHAAQVYTVNVIATATGTSGVTLQHVASVTLTIQ